MELKPMLKQKSTWAGIAGMVAALGGYFTGEMQGATAVQTIIVSLMAVFMPEFKK